MFSIIHKLVVAHTLRELLSSMFLKTGAQASVRGVAHAPNQSPVIVGLRRLHGGEIWITIVLFQCLNQSSSVPIGLFFRVTSWTVGWGVGGVGSRGGAVLSKLQLICERGSGDGLGWEQRLHFTSSDTGWSHMTAEGLCPPHYLLPYPHPGPLHYSCPATRPVAEAIDTLWQP